VAVMLNMDWETSLIGSWSQLASLNSTFAIELQKLFDCFMVNDVIFLHGGDFGFLYDILICILFRPCWTRRGTSLGCRERLTNQRSIQSIWVDMTSDGRSSDFSCKLPSGQSCGTDECRVSCFVIAPVTDRTSFHMRLLI
jgi:hypothetical protein